VPQDECSTPFYLSPTQNILPFTQWVLKLVVCVLCDEETYHNVAASADDAPTRRVDCPDVEITIADGFLAGVYAG
jgi:hypothetical protein